MGWFAKINTERAGLFATIFAAWNDLLIDGRDPSDDDIIREVRENWHEKKKRFTPQRIRTWIGWMRQNHVIPRGLGSRTTSVDRGK